MAYGRHPHVKTREQSLEQMIAASERNDVADIFGDPEITYEWRTPEHAVREINDGC